MCPFECSINIHDQLSRLLGKIELVVPSQIVDELSLLSERASGAKKKKALLALKLIKNCKVHDIDAEDGDEAVVALAVKLGGVVFSNDREVRSIARKAGLSVVFLRAKKTLALDGLE